MTLEEKLTAIKKHISLKNETFTGDIIIVGTPDGITYATVREIKPDIKKNWYLVRFILLVLPPVELTWTLREPQMCGEMFTIDGEKHFMAAVMLEPEPKGSHLNERECSTQTEKTGKIIPLRQKKKGS